MVDENYLEMANQLIEQAERDNPVNEVNVINYPYSPEHNIIMQNRKAAYDGALNYLESHLEENPDSIEALRNAAFIHQMYGIFFPVNEESRLINFQEGARYANKALDLLVKEDEYMISKDPLQTFKDLSQGEKDELAEFNGLKISLLFRSAYCHAVLGDHMPKGSEERLEQHQMALDKYHDIINGIVIIHQEIYPLIKKAHLNFADICFENGQPDLAFQTIERLVGYSTITPGLINPNDMPAIIRKLSDYNEAMKDMQQE